MRKQHQIYVLYLVAFMDLLAVSLMVPVLMPHIQSLGASPFFNGVLGSVFGAVQLISSPQVGSLSDNQGRKRVLSLCLVLSAAGYLLLGLATSLPVVLLSRVMSGLFKHTQNLSRAMVLDLVTWEAGGGSEQRAKVMGNFNALGSMGFIVGPTIGGHLAGMDSGIYLICCTAAGVFMLNWCLVLLCDESQSTAPSSNTSYSFLTAIDWSLCWDILTLRFLLSFAAIVYRSNFSLVLSTLFEATPVQIGYLTSLQGAASSISGLGIGSLANLYAGDSKRQLIHFTALQAVALVGLAVAPSMTMLCICLVPFSVANAVLRVACTEVTLEAVADNEGVRGIGGVVGAGQSVTSLARMVSPTFAGLAQEVSLRGPGLVGVVSSLTAFTLANIVSRRGFNASKRS